MLFDELASDPDRIAFRVGERSASRGELAKAAADIAGFLHTLGLRRGDAICAWLPDGGPWLQLLFGCSRVGMLMVPISTRYRSSEARHVLKTSRAKAIFVAKEFLNTDYAGMVAEIRGDLPDLEHILEVDQGDLFWTAPDAPAALRVDTGLADPLCVFSTSGTTSIPKLAVHDHGGILEHSRNVVARLDIRPGDTMLCALPLYGVLGFTTALAAIVGGASCSFLPVFNASDAATIMKRDAATHLYGSDGLIDRLLEVEGVDLSSWREGGFAEFAALGESVIRRAEDRWGVRLVSIYGSSECFAVTATRSPGDEPAQRLRAGGRPVSEEISSRVVDLDSGQPVADGEPGELQIRGYNVMTEYLNNPEATARAFTADGWYRTGDYAIADGQEFTFLSRLGDGLRLRGYLVDPAEIETTLVEHPAVAAAQVVGVKRTGDGDVAVAFVLGASNSVSEGDLISYCREHMANYKVPRRIVFIDCFPSVDGPNGTKILRTELRNMAEQLIPQVKEHAHEAR